MIVVLVACWVILSVATYLAPSIITVILVGLTIGGLLGAGASGHQVVGVLAAGLLAGLLVKRLLASTTETQ